MEKKNIAYTEKTWKENSLLNMPRIENFERPRILGLGFKVTQALDSKGGVQILLRLEYRLE